MADFGITYTQLKSAEGSYVYRMEPDLEVLAQFSGMIFSFLEGFCVKR